jgi:hypothetical protein
VTDEDGVVTTVYGLQAKYEASGMWLGRRPTKIAPVLGIIKETREGRIAALEEVQIKFSEIRKITCNRESPNVISGYKIELRDGTSFLDSNFVLGEYNGVPLKLEGFLGKAKMSTGKTGEFYITILDFLTIEFK